MSSLFPHLRGEDAIKVKEQKDSVKVSNGKMSGKLWLLTYDYVCFMVCFVIKILCSICLEGQRGKSLLESN